MESKKSIIYIALFKLFLRIGSKTFHPTDAMTFFESSKTFKP